jgi:hypothetical protein
MNAPRFTAEEFNAADAYRKDVEPHEFKNAGHSGFLAGVAHSRAQLLELVEALEEMTPPMPPVNGHCHVGIVTQEKCANCQRIARARAAIAKFRGRS